MINKTIENLGRILDGHYEREWVEDAIIMLRKMAEPKPTLHPTDIYNFAGWLTMRPGMMKVGSAFDAAPMADAVGEYLDKFPERFAALVPASDLAEAVEKLYFAAHWTPDRECDAAALWTAVRDAAGIAPGQTTERLGAAPLKTLLQQAQESHDAREVPAITAEQKAELERYKEVLHYLRSELLHSEKGSYYGALWRAIDKALRGEDFYNES